LKECAEAIHEALVMSEEEAITRWKVSNIFSNNLLIVVKPNLLIFLGIIHIYIFE